VGRKRTARSEPKNKKKMRPRQAKGKLPSEVKTGLRASSGEEKQKKIE